MVRDALQPPNDAGASWNRLTSWLRKIEALKSAV